MSLGVQVNSLNVNSGEFENKLTVTDLRYKIDKIT